MTQIKIILLKGKNNIEINVILLYHKCQSFYALDMDNYKSKNVIWCRENMLYLFEI